MTKKNTGSTAESVPVLKRIGQRAVRVSGSKSLTARAIMLGALGAGRTVLQYPLVSDDTTLLADAMATIGAGVNWTSHALVLHGVDGKPPRGGNVHLGAGGTPTRYMIAAGSLAMAPVTVDGSAWMRTRPIGELISMLKTLGAKFDGDCLPIQVDGTTLCGGTLDVPVTKSSQFISALLLIAPFVKHGITLNCESPVTSEPYVDLTIDMLHTFGVDVQSEQGETRRTICVPETRITHKEFAIEPDASSAVYFAAIAALHQGMTIILKDLSLDSSQPDMAAIRLLGEMGADVRDDDSSVRVTGTGIIHSFGDLDASGFPDASLCLAAVAAFADGPSRLYGLETLPLKESDRIEVMSRSLAKVGCGIASSDSEIRITPMAKTTEKTAIDPMGDHRIAMAMAVLGTKRGGVSIVDPSCVSKSYPTFWTDLRMVYEGRDET